MRTDRYRHASITLFVLLLVLGAGTAFSAAPPHKLVAAKGLLDEKSPGVRLIEDYGSYRLYQVTDEALRALPQDKRERARVADEMDVIQLDAYPLDTRRPVAGLPPALMATPVTGPALHLVQFVGPIKESWLDALRQIGARPVQYIESNAYLVWADGAGRQALERLAAKRDFVQYSGPYHPYYKLGPTLREPVAGAAADRLVPVTIQMLDHEGKTGTEDRIATASVSSDSSWHPVLAYQNIDVTLPLSRVAEIASLPDVTWIGERLPYRLLDEVQDQIVAAHFNGPQTGPSAPGYKAFLDSKGFSSDPSTYPIVVVTDDGVGNGSATNGAGDPTLTALGDGTTTRLVAVSNCTPDADAGSVGGHGHINTSIVGGYDVRAGDPFRDADGYQRGLGLSPYGRLAHTKIFTNAGSCDTSACGGSSGCLGTLTAVVEANYATGAKISSNSWGCSGCSGTYSVDSQAYDAGTRDASAGTAGNQELLFVFAAGNSGPGAATVGTPGNGKNMVTVGASENYRPTWTDGCAVGPTGADNAMDVIGFSSRGPTPGGRLKPEVIAPGTHIQGTASTNPGYNGTSVCDQFLPAGQTVFAASSGTSHSTPAVAGMASLYFRWLQDHFLSAVPSPALVKAYLMAHTTYLTGVGANDTLPSNTQGYGMPNLEMGFDDTTRYLLDQSVVLDNSGDTWTFHGSIADPSRPVRVMMVYTDAPGAVGTSPQVNNLDLAVTVNSTTYLGNVYSGQYSVTGGSADTANNYEGVSLPAGTAGALSITVTGFNIAGDGVPNHGDGTDQDFALVCYNCSQCASSVTLNKSVYKCTDTMAITLVDIDLTGTGMHDVQVRSTTEPTPENVTLTENPPNSGVFVGSFPTFPGAPANGDGKISVTDGDTITVSYLDALSCGTPNVLVEKTAAVDCASPVITNVRAENVTGNSADIKWDTNEGADSQVTYGIVSPPGTVGPVNPTRVTAHTYHLSGLDECTQFLYSVASRDLAGNGSVADNGGAYFTFQTSKNVNPTYTYGGPPVSIPDNNPAGAVATITIPDSKTIQDVNVKTSIAHSYDGDLILSLIGPDNTTVLLSNRRGGAGDNFTNTVFDDSASTPIASGAAPFNGAFIPDAPLAAFNGKVAAGTWTLKVVDAAGVDTGTINQFELTMLFPAEPCPTVGTITLDRTVYRCSDTVSITVVDHNASPGSQPVTIVSGTEPGGETVVLTETSPGSGRFVGSIPLSTLPPSGGDGQLSIANGDTITATYIDADDGYGNFNVPRTTTASVDCAPPVITNVQATNITGDTVDITFTTNEPGDTVVHYGTTTPPGTPASSAAFVTSHTLHLTGLTPCTPYYFSVSSTDPTGNGATNDNGGAYYAFTTLVNNNPTYSYGGPPVPIPDNDPTGAVATVNVADVQSIQDLNVQVSITHTFDGDLILSLIGPDSTTVVLSNRRGSSGDNFTNTVFDDAAANPISGGTPPFTGSFRPEDPLTNFNGRFANGTWTLKVVDAAGIDTGSITAFSLSFTYPPRPCGQPILQKRSYSVTDACSAGGVGNADGIVDPGETLSIPLELLNTGTGGASGITATLTTTDPTVLFPRGGASYGNLAIGQSAFGNQPFLVEVGTGETCGTLIPFQVNIGANEGSWTDSFSVRVGSPVFNSNTYPSSDVPKTITDNSTVTSTIAVSDTGTVGDVNVQLSIQHTYDGDLALTLIGPNATRVTLSNRHGVGGDNYNGTIFDDQASTPIASGTPPYAGSFRPDQPLSVLNGIPANGTWTLEVRDLAGGDTGTLSAWSLTITTPNGYACHGCSVTAPGDVGPSVQFDTKDAVSWSPVTGATAYHLYRGADLDLPKLFDANVDSCERATTASSGATGIGEIPSAFRMVWYLVRASNAGGYGPAGNGSVAGAPVPRVHDSSGACP